MRKSCWLQKLGRLAPLKPHPSWAWCGRFIYERPRGKKQLAGSIDVAKKRRSQMDTLTWIFQLKSSWTWGNQEKFVIFAWDKKDNFYRQGFSQMVAGVSCGRPVLEEKNF